jgi:carboxyl-terminal processing protease
LEENNNGLGKKSYFYGMASGLLLCAVLIGLFIAFRFLYLQGNVLSGDILSVIFESDSGAVTDDVTTVVDDHTVQKMEAIIELINENYYQADITTAQLEEGIYRGIVDALDDPYAEYYSAEELADASANMEGVTYGIGAYISYDDEMELAYISGIIEGGSAEESELRVGDFIVMVDDIDVQSYNSTEVVMLVRGQENTSVHLSIYREGEPEFLEFDLIRKKALENPTVSYGTIEENIGYIGITEFDEVTLDQYAEAMAVLKEEDIKGLILDLRNNPGGNVSTVTEIARRILPEGLIVYTEDRNGYREEYTCDGEHELMLPLVVLVNEYSASASEILAGSIQDYDKGTVVGTTTYGKGVVQRIIALSDRTAVKLTVSSYYTPLGRSLSGVGITPDVEVDIDWEAYYADGTDAQLDKAIELIKEEIE